MEKIILSGFVKLKLKDLFETLIRENYFVIEENAQAYVDELIDFIYKIDTQRQRQTADDRHGEWYCEYKPNKRTTWFITFDKKGENYLVRNLINNHTKEYPEFIRGNK